MKSISNISKYELEQLIKESTSIAEVLRKLSYTPCSTAYKTFYKKIESENILLTNILSSNRNLGNNRFGIKVSSKEEYIKKYLRLNASKPELQKLFEYAILEKKCAVDGCNICENWNNKPIRLQLDHINGNNKDQRIENLRAICPNCHSQTDTFSGRNIKLEWKYKKEVLIKNCGACLCEYKTTRKNSKFCSKKCSSKSQQKIKRPAIDELLNDLKTMSMVSVGKKYGVSDNAIRKWIKMAS